MAKIAPSILSADFVNLERDIRSLSTHGADLVHGRLRPRAAPVSGQEAVVRADHRRDGAEMEGEETCVS